MNWQEALSHIESPEFDAELNMLSGTSAFFRAVRDDPVVKETLRLMLDSGEIQEEALGRIWDLASLETDPHYENPHDTPLAVLLWLTRYTNRHFALVGAHYVEQAPRCWYAHKIARQISNPPAAGSLDVSANAGTAPRILSNSSSTEASLTMSSPVGKVRFVATPADNMTFRSKDSVQTQETVIESDLGSSL